MPRTVGADTGHRKNIDVINIHENRRNSNHPAVQLTIFTARRGAVLTKTLGLDADGKLTKTTGNAGSGTATTITLTLADLAARLPTFKPSECLIHGVTDQQTTKIVVSGSAVEGDISRTKSHFHYPDSPAIMMFDHDVDGVGRYYTPDELVALLAEADPQLRDAAHVVSYSTSANVSDKDGNSLSTKQPGYHLYFVVAHGTDIPRYGKLIFKRLGMLGHVHCRLSESASVLVRGPFDAAVFSPERCDFVSPPILKDGLTQDRPAPVVVSGEPLVDTAALPDLTAGEKARYYRAERAAKELIKPQIEPAVQMYVTRKAAKTGQSETVIRQQLKMREVGRFDAEMVVYTKDGGVKTTLGELALGDRPVYILNPFDDGGPCPRVYPDTSPLKLKGAYLHDFSGGGCQHKIVFSPNRNIIPRVSIQQGRAELAAVMKTFIFDTVMQWGGEGDLPVGVFKVTTGGGKTWLMHKFIREYIATSGKRVIIAAPTQSLASEQAEDLLKETARRVSASTGLRVEVWRGLSQPDPNAPGKTMCQDLELSGAAFLAGVELKEACKRCPLRSGCGYQRQQNKRPDIWVVPHEMLFRPMVGAFKDNIGLLVIDEDIRGTAFAAGVKGKGIRLAVSTLESSLPGTSFTGNRAAIRARRDLLRMCLNKAGERRPLLRSDFDGLIDAESADDAYKNENAYVKPPIMPAGRDRFIQAMNDLHQQSGLVNPYIPLLWRLIRDWLRGTDEQCPNIEVIPHKKLANNEGSGRFVSMQYRRNIHADWSIPTMILDATADIDVLRYIFPTAQQLADINIETPHQRVIRVTGKTFAKYGFVQSELELAANLTNVVAPGARDVVSERNVTRVNTLRKLRRLVEVLARAHYPNDVGLICNLAVKDALLKTPLPENVILGHFNDTKGSNKWSNCSAFLIVGRTLPDDDAIAKQARAFAGSWDCGGLAKSLRWQICEAELIQNIGRPRGVNRTERNQVDIYLLNDIELPVDIAEEISWDDIQPTPGELMLARGVIMDCERDTKGYWNIVQSVVPDLLSTIQAAKNWGRKSLTVLNTYRDIYIGVQHREERGIPKGASFCEKLGKATVKIGRYAVPVRFRAGIDFIDIFGPAADISVTVWPYIIAIRATASQILMGYVTPETTAHPHPMIRKLMDW